jgi:hypothetical protein
MSKIVSISAKCSDLFNACLSGDDRNQIGQDYDGYVPKWFPGDHYGDYIILDIDIETGRITNWKTPTEQQLAKTFKIAD